MKIAVVIQNFSRRAGGVSEVVAAHCRELKKHGYSVRIFCGKDGFIAADYGDEFDVKALPLITNSFGYLVGLTKSIVEFCPDVIHAHGVWAYASWGARRAAQRLRKPLVITPHGMLGVDVMRYSSTKKRLARLIYEDANFRYAAAYHALCESEKQEFIDFGLVESKIRVIPNGVYIPDKKRALAGKDNPLRLLYLGRVHHKKGLDLLLQALSKVPANVLAPWEIDIVGWGDASFIDDMEALASSLSLLHKVHFLGPKYGKEKTDMYDNAAGFILPSRSEGLPMSVLEAWSHGLPVLMTEQCHLPEGFSAKAAVKLPLDIQGMTEELTGFFSASSEERYSMGDNGYRLVQNNFSWQHIGDMLSNMYSSLIRGGDVKS